MLKLSSYHGLRIWTAMQGLSSSPPAQETPSSSTSDAATNQDPLTVEQATRGMALEQKNSWLHAQLGHTIDDMKDSGIALARNSIFDAFFSDDVAEFARVTPGGHLGNPIHLDTKASVLSIKDLRTLLAHEVFHTQQPAARTKHDQTLMERAADHAAAQTYGAQATIDMLQRLSEIQHVAPKARLRGDPHDSIRKRQELVQKDFPDQHAIIPGIKDRQKKPGTSHWFTNA